MFNFNTWKLHWNDMQSRLRFYSIASEAWHKVLEEKALLLMELTEAMVEAEASGDTEAMAKVLEAAKLVSGVKP